MSYKDPPEELPDPDNESSWDNSSSTSEINSSTWDSLNEQLRDTFCKVCFISDQSGDQRTFFLKKGRKTLFCFPSKFASCVFSSTVDSMQESYLKDELEKERSVTRELQVRLQEKETQLKISERQKEKIKRQMMTANTLVRIQQEQIKRLKLDISKLGESQQHNGDPGPGGS